MAVYDTPLLQPDRIYLPWYDDDPRCMAWWTSRTKRIMLEDVEYVRIAEEERDAILWAARLASRLAFVGTAATLRRLAGEEEETP